MARAFRDDEGYLYEVQVFGDRPFYYRVTECCESPATIYLDTGETVCKGCYEVVDPAIGGSPVIRGVNP